MTVQMLRNCASESNLVLLAKRLEVQEEYKKKMLREQVVLKEGERKQKSSAGSTTKSNFIAALLLAALAWSLRLHFDDKDVDFARALDTLDNECPVLARADNSSVSLADVFDYSKFQGDWHKVAWLREPDAKDEMRCRFVTDTERARDLQHLEQISPANYQSKGYHFLLNRVSKLWVVDTDYKSWAMLYTCSPHFGTMTQQAFIVSRKSTLDIVTMGDVLTKWSEYNVPWKEFKIKEQQHQCS